MKPFMCLMCFALVVVPSRTLANELTSEEIVARADEATVLIGTGDTNLSEFGLGSGFFVTPNLIVTNFHVIEDASVIAYMRYGQEKFHSIDSIRDVESNYDLAVLKVPSARVKPLYLGDSDAVKKGETVYVAGNPHGLVGTISKGIISGRQTSPGYSYIRKGVKLIQFEASVAHGSSGGPVFNGRGEVIGVVSFGIGDSATGDFNFAIPSNYLKTMLRKLGVRLPPRPQPDSRSSKRRNEEKAQADVERAIAEARKVEAEAKKVEAEADKAKAEADKAKANAEAEKAKADAEKAKAEAERAKAEAKKAEAEHAKVEAEKVKAEAESPKEKKAKVSEPKTGTIDQLQAATVHIYGRDRNGKEGRLGSGFFVREDQVATDFHVVDGSTLKGVKPIGQTTRSVDVLIAAQLLKTDRARHLAILQVEKADVQPLPIGNSDKIQEDEEIRVFSNTSIPAGKFTEGNISGTPSISGVRYFEFDAPVEPGSSGGPIVNARGEVIAVTALKVVAITGTLKNAIPSNYLRELLAGKGDRTPNLPLPPPRTKPRVSPKLESLSESSPYGDWLESGIKHYGQAKYDAAIRLLQSALDGLTLPKNRAKAHLYLGCARRGRGDSQESVVAEFSEALAYKPCLVLPPKVGQNHPIFNPLLEKTREETTGTLTVNASPPETKIWIYGGESKQENPYVGTVTLRLFKGDYTVVCFLEQARDVKSVKTVHVEPAVRHILDREITRMPSTSRELTLELDRVVKPQRVEVHYEIYGPTGVELDRGVNLMQLQGEKPDLGSWIYHVKWPPSTPAGRLVYRIKVDGKDILPIPPPEIVILEPPSDTWVYINQAIDLKARVTSDIQLTEVLVHYSDASKKLRKMDTPDTYIGTITARDNREAGTIWYFVTAKDLEGTISRSEVRLVEIRRLDDETDTDSVPAPEITVLAPRGSAVLPINKAINIEAEVESNAPLKEVRVYYNSKRKGLSEASLSAILENKSSDTYTGKIPKEHSREEGYIWYFVLATTQNGMKSEPIDRVVEIKELETRIHQGVWASHSWSSYVQNDLLLNSDWARGDVVSLSFLSEGKGFQTIGARLDFPYENSANTSAAIQWGPRLKDSHIAFAFLAGVAGYRRSDASFSRARQSTEITPLLGGSLKFYPLDRVVVDVTGSIKLRSENSASDRSSSFTKEYLHHYEMGIRLYISPTLNLKAGYGEWRIGEYNNTSVQIGLGSTF